MHNYSANYVNGNQDKQILSKVQMSRCKCKQQAARNILLAEHNVIKICDFGLAKNMYSQNYYRKKSGVSISNQGSIS